jgi:LCP family protein required for cell wall assembly
VTSTLEPTRRAARAGKSGIVRHRAGRQPGGAGAILTFAATALAVLLVSSLATAAVLVAGTVSHIKPGVPLLDASGNVAPIPQVGAVDGGANILLAGTDTRTNQGGEFATQDQLNGSSGVGSNDVTMVLHIAADHQSAAVISIPRDLILPIPACPDPSGGTFYAQSAGMFNTTLSQGGISCVVLTAEQLTGLKIQYAATINFDGVMAMADAVGGVNVCLDAAVNDPESGLDLPAGTSHIAGSMALAFVRSRAGVGDGSDLGRISNQQVFLSALMRQITSGGVLSNPLQLYRLATAAATNLQATSSLADPTEMVSLALAMKNIRLDNIVFLQYPTVSDPDNPNRVVTNIDAAAALNTALASNDPLQLTGTLGRGAIADTAPPAPVPTSTPSILDSLRIPVPSATPTATVAPTAPVPLPTNISGQTAAQATCGKANQ